MADHYVQIEIRTSGAPLKNKQKNKNILQYNEMKNEIYLHENVSNCANFNVNNCSALENGNKGYTNINNCATDVQ